MKLIFCITILLCPYMSPAQQALTVGNKLPAAVLQQLQTNSGQPLASLQGNKWLVLDFMASTCASCIRLLPAFNDLQKKYADQLEIVLVTAQPPEKMQAFLQKNPAINFPFIAGDTALHQYFPHEFISHLVWINPEGMVKAITSGYYLTAKSFLQARSGVPLYWPVKQDGKPYDNDKALLTYHPANLQESFTEAPLYYTAVRPALPDVVAQARVISDTLNKVKRYSFINQSLPQMMSKIWGKPTMPASYFLINSHKGSKLFHMLDTLLKDDWEIINEHCLEMQLPMDATKADALQQFNNALRQYFKVEASLDVVERRVWQVSGKPKTPIKPLPGYSPQALGIVIKQLNKAAGTIPVIAAKGTSLNDKIPMPLPGSINREAVLQLLSNYGYQVADTTTQLESIIISNN